MILYTFGDSHRCSIVCSLEGTPINSIKHGSGGAYTMARFGMEKTNLINIQNYGVKENDAVCFCFGEIDCRSHLCRDGIFQNKEILVEEIVSRYFEAINQNISPYKKILTFIFNVVPPIKFQKGIYQHPEFPHRGSDEQRIEVTLLMNKKLKEYCSKNGFLFFDVYEKYAGPDGLLIPELSDGTVHIGNGKYMTEFLKSINYE